MQRRKFIQLVGGGVALASLGALSACSTQIPDEAVEAWRGPGNETDVRLWALSYAILAPNPHNLQPWRVDLRAANSISLYVDRERLLPNTDPWFRQVMVGQGTFLELLVIALKERGIAPQVTLFPEGEFPARTLDARPVAKITWDTAAPAPEKDPLFAQILRRHTAKVAFDTTRFVAPEEMEAVQQSAAIGAPEYLKFAYTVDLDRQKSLRTLALNAARAEVGTPSTALESSRLTRIGPDEILRHRDGISLNNVMPRFAVAVGLFDRAKAPTVGSSSFDLMMQFYEDSINSAAGFNWITTQAPERLRRSAEVWAGRVFVRQQLKACEVGLQIHPLSQAPQEFPEMKQYYEEIHQRLVGTADGSKFVQMFCRVGYCSPQQHSPRRPLRAMLLT
jgi:hypothetical protein